MGLALTIALAGLLFVLFSSIRQPAALALSGLAGEAPERLQRSIRHGPASSSPLLPEASSRSPVLSGGAVLTFALSYVPAGLDPALVSDSTSLLVTRQIYETLLDFQPGGTLVVPGLAEAWSASPDGLTWTFQLRPGVKFHDGTDLDAAAVLFNWERWWDPDNPYHDGSFGFFEAMFGGFKGDPDCLISGLGTVGTDQLQIALSRPYSPMLSTLPIGAFAIASPAAIEAGTLITQPVGSGPFRIVEWNPDERIRLAAYPAYWGADPLLNALTFQTIADADERFDALQANAVQGIHEIDASYVPTASLDANLQVLWRPALNTGYIGINRAHSPLDNPLVGRAIAHAINKQALIDDIYNAVADAGQLATQLLPPPIWGRDEDLEDYTYDPPLASALLDDAGYPDGFTTTLWVLPVERSYLPHAWDIAAAMQADLEAVGITATLVTYDWPTYVQKVGDGEADLFMLGWFGDSGHPDNFFYPLLCTSYLRHGPRDDVLCGLLEAAWAVDDFDTLVGMYESASGRVHDTLPLIPIGHARRPLILRHDVVGLVPEAVGGELFRDVFLARSVYLPAVFRSHP